MRIDQDDQVRVATPETALTNGDYLVMGRTFLVIYKKVLDIPVWPDIL